MTEKSDEFEMNYGALGFKTKEIRIDYGESSVDVVVIR